jgi:hypothetical protein
VKDAKDLKSGGRKDTKNALKIAETDVPKLNFGFLGSRLKSILRSTKPVALRRNGLPPGPYGKRL